MNGVLLGVWQRLLVSDSNGTPRSRLQKDGEAGYTVGTLAGITTCKKLRSLSNPHLRATTVDYTLASPSSMFAHKEDLLTNREVLRMTMLP